MRCLLFLSLCWTLIAVQPAVAQLRFERKPIEYSKSPAHDGVALLIEQIQQDKRALRREDRYGYLGSLLEALKVPVSSQTLVFSKTSLQRHLISPSNPRAIYFNDDIYVAWVPEGKMIEIASVDPILGTVFYTIDQDDGKRAGEIQRRTQRCLFCHASSDTGRVPGLLMQSVYSDPGGNRVFSASAIPTDSKGPLQGRWAGWFVSGTHGRQRHLGNLMINEGASVTVDDTNNSANVTDLSRWFDVDKYVSPHSDIVALLLLRHQVTIHNLLIDANHRARLQLHRDAEVPRDEKHQTSSIAEETAIELDQLAEQVVDGLLMVGEAEFSDSISGTSSFAKEFSDRGPKDSRGRSLRDLDLTKSLFRYSCSYLIYTDSFDSLPGPLLQRTYQRLFEVLTSNDQREKYRHLSQDNRNAILQILGETKNNIPSSWKTSSE